MPISVRPVFPAPTPSAGGGAPSPGEPAARIRDGFPGQRMFVLPRPVVRAALQSPDAPDLLPTDVGYFPDAAGHEVRRDGGVDQLVVMVCLRGEGWARVGGDGGRPLAVAAGDLLVLPPHRPHVYGADAARPWSIYWIHVAGKKAGLLHRLLSDEDAAPVSAVGAPPAVYALFEEILDTLRHSYGREHLLIAALATGHLLGQLLALHRRRPAAASARERIDQTIQFVRARLGARISVPELARLANLSCSHFAATFKRQTGYAVLEYFMRLRMQKAAHLLDTTALPVKAVAATVGYDDPLYFSRLFRRIYDLSPARYRQIKKG